MESSSKDNEELLWDNYARLYNKIARCLEKSKMDTKHLQMLIELAVKLYRSN